MRYKKIIIIWDKERGAPASYHPVVYRAGHELEDNIPPYWEAVGPWTATKAEYDAYRRQYQDDLREYMTRQVPEYYDDAYGGHVCVGYTHRLNRHLRRRLYSGKPEDLRAMDAFFAALYGPEDD